MTYEIREKSYPTNDFIEIYFFNAFVGFLSLMW